MDEQKPLENKQGEPGKKTEKSEYSFMQETIKDENSRGKKCRKDLLRMRSEEHTSELSHNRESRMPSSA